VSFNLILIWIKAPMARSNRIAVIFLSRVDSRRNFSELRNTTYWRAGIRQHISENRKPISLRALMLSRLRSTSLSSFSVLSLPFRPPWHVRPCVGASPDYQADRFAALIRIRRQSVSDATFSAKKPDRRLLSRTSDVGSNLIDMNQPQQA